MRFFDTDWNMILLWLGAWEKLPPTARRYYLSGKSHAQSLSPGGYGPDLELVLRLGLGQQVSTGNVRPTPASTRFRAVMVQLAKWPLFDGKPDRRQLKDYLGKHFNTEEYNSIVSHSPRPSYDSPALPASFLEAKDVSAWEQPLLSYFELGGARYGYGWGQTESKKKTWFPTPETIETARWLVRHLLEAKRALPLRSLAEELPEHLRPALDSAIKACLRHALLFAALDGKSHDLLVGVCPLILYVATRPASVPPAVQECSDAAGVAFQVEDMTRVLALAATGECLINQGSYYREFFKAVEVRLKEEFVPLPGWLAGRADFTERLHAASNRLLKLGFAIDTYKKEPKRKLKTTAAGRKWLTQSPAGRLRQALLEYLRHCNLEDWEQDEDDWDYDGSWEDQEEFEEESIEFAGVEEASFSSSRRGPAQRFDLLRWQKSVWRQAPTAACVSLDAFLDYHARVNYPRPEDRSSQKSSRSSAEGPRVWRRDLDDLRAEEHCRDLLKNFFWRVLAPFGCVEATLRGKGAIWFRLSSAGQYLAGLKPALEHGQATHDRSIIVQPNFEVVFLAPNLAAEIEVAPFAERCGRDVGTMFRLTRPRMILAASGGATPEAVLATLAKHSAKPVPPNVIEEVKAWFSACRSLTMRHSTLIHAGDAEAALRAKQLLGPECAQLSARLLEWPEPEIPPKLLKKLRENGLFLGESSGA